MNQIYLNLKSYFKLCLYRFSEALFVTKNQYKLKLLHFYKAKNNQIIAIMQVAFKRVKIKFSVCYLASNPKILQHIHPADVCKISFIANIGNDIEFENIPEYIKIINPLLSVINQNPTLKINFQSFNNGKETLFEIEDLNLNYRKTITSTELIQNDSLLYSLGSLDAARVGISASNDFLNTIPLVNNKNAFKKNSQNTSNFHYYHVLCMTYITLLLTGLSIVRRMFPFYIPFTDMIVPFGGGIIFFPVTFCIQDITTEVYGFSAARKMIVFSMFSILFYVLYTQMVIHLPTANGAVYQDNLAFLTVFNTQPRQVVALLVSLFLGSIINDFFISKSKIIVAGQYLWARILGSTMIGEAILQVVGGIIGFSDKLDFKTQLLPNMILAYGYKLLWCGASIPLIYIISNFLKKKEGIDVFDYNVDYNPFQLSVAEKNN